MPRVRLVLEDEYGNLIAGTERVYVLEGACDTLDSIESAVETLRKSALPAVEHALLAQAQQQYVSEAKKGERIA